MSTIKSSAENLTLNADGANNDIKFQSNGSEVASIDQAGVVTATSFAGSGANLTGLSSFNPDAAVTINESGADVDFRVESDGLTHALFVEGGNGRIGVNTSSPDYSLHMVGDRLMTENLSNGNTGIFMRVKNGGSQVGNATIRTNNNGDISIYQGTSSEALRATLKQGGGICFNSDTATANALDDYEEGTWTPSILVGSGLSIGNVHQNRYTKIGRVVSLNAAFNIDSSNNPGQGAVRIGGFPFAMSSFSNGGFPLDVHYCYKVTPMAFIASNGYCYYQGTTVGGNNQNDLGPGLDAVTVISLVYSYVTT
jgi:hypothetical protein